MYLEVVILWTTLYLQLKCQLIIEVFVQLILPLKLWIFEYCHFSVLNLHFSFLHLYKFLALMEKKIREDSKEKMKLVTLIEK